MHVLISPPREPIPLFSTQHLNTIPPTLRRNINYSATGTFGPGGKEVDGTVDLRTGSMTKGGKLSAYYNLIILSDGGITHGPPGVARGLPESRVQHYTVLSPQVSGAMEKVSHVVFTVI